MKPIAAVLSEAAQRHEEFFHHRVGFAFGLPGAETDEHAYCDEDDAGYWRLQRGNDLFADSDEDKEHGQGGHEHAEPIPRHD